MRAAPERQRRSPCEEAERLRLRSAPQPPVLVVFRVHLSQSRKITSICQSRALLFPFYEAVGSSNNFFVKRKHTERGREGGREGERRERGGRGGRSERVGEALNHGFIFRSSNFIFWVSEGFGKKEREGKKKKSLFFLLILFLHFRHTNGSQSRKLRGKKNSENLEIFSLLIYFFFANSGAFGGDLFLLFFFFFSLLVYRRAFRLHNRFILQPSGSKCVSVTNRDFFAPLSPLCLRGSAVSKSRLNTA